jgi:hypothetical protein
MVKRLSPIHKYLEMFDNAGISVLFITALGYLTAYAFQYTFYLSFGISYKLININVSTLIISLIFSGFGLVYFIIAADWISTKGKSIYKANVTSRAVRALAELVFMFLLLLLGAWVLSIRVDFLPATLMLALVIAKGFIALVTPLVTFIGKRIARKRKNAVKSTRHDAITMPFTLEDRAELQLKLKLSIIVIAVSLCIGKFYATVDSSFPIVQTNGNIQKVLIQEAGDTIIMKDYDKKQGVFLDGYYIKKGDKEYHVSSNLKTGEHKEPTALPWEKLDDWYRKAISFL